MTRTEQAKRRKAILAAVRAGHSKVDVAIQFNLCRDTIDKACQGHGFLSLRDKNERLWVARYLHRQITAIMKRTGKPMLQVVNELIRRGLADSREDKLKRRGR